MRLSKLFVVIGLYAAGLSFASASRATVVERIVAVIGERAVLLSDLRARARPFLLRVEAQPLDDAQRAAATSQIYEQMLTRMVDEELQERAATQANITVTAREVDDAMARVAAQNRVTVQRVIAEARASGLTEVQYRQEIRRQLLEAKLLNLRVQGRLRVTQSDIEAEYAALVQEERARLAYRPALVRIPAPRSLSKRDLAKRHALAEQVAGELRAGAALPELLSRLEGKATGGLLGKVRPGELAPALDRTARLLEPGEISDPVRHAEELIVLQLIEREPSKLPPLEEARQELGQRVYMEKMEAARRNWLDGLRRRYHVDVRL